MQYSFLSAIGNYAPPEVSHFFKEGWATLAQSKFCQERAGKEGGHLVREFTNILKIGNLKVKEKSLERPVP